MSARPSLLSSAEIVTPSMRSALNRYCACSKVNSNYYFRVSFLFTVSIDGVDWPTSRFFQVAPGWRTHVKVFPLVCMSPIFNSSYPSAPAFALPLANFMGGLSGHPASPPPPPSTQTSLSQPHAFPATVAASALARASTIASS